MIVREFESNHIWFFTNLTGQKADALAHEPQVNISFSDVNHGKFISLSATAIVVKDPLKIRQLWHPSDMTWFPAGETDVNLALIKADIKSAECWDEKMGLMITLYSFAKAILTGKDPVVGDKIPGHKNVKLSSQEIHNHNV